MAHSRTEEEPLPESRMAFLASGASPSRPCTCRRRTWRPSDPPAWGLSTAPTSNSWRCWAPPKTATIRHSLDREVLAACEAPAGGAPTSRGALGRARGPRGGLGLRPGRGAQGKSRVAWCQYLIATLWPHKVLRLHYRGQVEGQRSPVLQDARHRVAQPPEVCQAKQPCSGRLASGGASPGTGRRASRFRSRGLGHRRPALPGCGGTGRPQRGAECGVPSEGHVAPGVS